MKIIIQYEKEQGEGELSTGITIRNMIEKKYPDMNVEIRDIKHSINSMKENFDKFIKEKSYSVCESGDHNMVNIVETEDLKELRKILFGDK